MKRFAAVLSLALLSPLIAEYLSGSMSFSQIAAMPVMLAMYGGGAVLIRETVRRSGRGWPSILLLGLAYALVEEGIADQSLFNPNFAGLRLLDPGFIPALGMGVPWTIYVLSIHVIWSIAVPIALAESLFADIRQQPWLGRIGVGVAALIYAAGVALITLYFSKTFFASPAQIGASVIAVVILIVAAFAVPKVLSSKSGLAPSPGIVGSVGFMATSVLVLLYGQGVQLWPWQIVAGTMAVLLLLLLVFAYETSRRSGWQPMHSYAFAAGALVTYCWIGFSAEIALHGRAMLWAHAILAAAMLALLAIVGWKLHLRSKEV